MFTVFLPEYARTHIYSHIVYILSFESTLIAEA